MSKEVAEEYLSSLADLTVNSKPLINMLTMLADENVDHAPAIVQVIESHIQKVSPEVKLPILYLIDSIIKNVPRVYVPLFTQNIVNIFVSVFEKVDEKTRLNMYKLRQTWNDVFPPRKLYALDLRVKDIDNAWPVTAPPPTSIHLNPKFLQGNKAVIPEVTTAVTTPQVTAPAATNPSTPITSENELKEQLLKKQAILIELQKKKLELELLQAKAKLEEQQQKQLKEQQGAGALLVNLANRPAITEEAVKLLTQKALLKPKAVVMPPSTDSAKPNVGNSRYWISNTVMMPYNSYQNIPNIQMTSLSNATSTHYKTKIAPANTQIIEAVKSRDPRIARQQQPQTSSQPPAQQPKGSADASYKEQEILARQLAMLKTPFVDQVAPVAPVQRVLSESNAKSHITINVERNRDRIDTKTNKKQSKDNSKSDSSNRNRLKPSSPRDSSKTSPNKSSKLSPPSRDSKISSPKRSQKRNSSPDRPRTPSKNFQAPRELSTRNIEQIKKFEPYNKSPKKSSKSSFSPKKGRNYLKNEKPSSKREIIESDDKTEKSKSKKKSSPSRVVNKERSKSPPKEKTENAENIPEVKQTESPKKDKKKEKKSENSDKIKKLDNSYLELIESSPSPEPPPPPIISRTGDDSFSDKKEDASFEDDSEDDKKKKKEVTGFKDIKGMKGRNYIRRNREPSTSPQKEVTGDVDHRVAGPPEKQPRLIIQEENVSDIEKSLVNVSGKDVDLRVMVGSGSPSKKRLSTDTPTEEPPKKKNKSEVFDELFGHEDVDLRQMPTANLNPSELLPSPPPPPVISNGPQIPQIAAIAPLVVEGSKLSPKPEETQQGDSQDNGENSRDSFDGTLGRYRRPRGDLKNKPEAEIKPMSLSSQLELEIQPKREPVSSFETPEKDRRKHFSERGSPRGELDRLGRPLLYNKLPNDPRARRESLVDSRDTDMRRFGGLIDRDRDSDTDTNININLIIAQAQDQLRNGSISVAAYNEILAQVIRVNEEQKIREAQNKSRQESRRMHHRGRRSPPSRFGPRNSPPFRHDEDRRDRRPFNDIDERLPVPWRARLRNEGNAGYNRMGYPPGANRSNYDVSGVDRNFEDRPIKTEIWEDERLRFRRTQQIDDLEKPEKRTREVICSERTHDCVDVPMSDYKTLELIAKDPMKSINIDGTPRDIRFYGDTAVVMLSWDDPKEISFEDGLRRVAIGDQNFTCALNHPYTVIMVNGNPHRIRLGAPTRELYIDGEFYEVHFGGNPVQIQLDGIQYFVQLEGPPPQVKIGEKRTDLICGKVNLIVDATVMLPLYLDAKPQRFDLRNRPYVFRFVNSLKTLLINEVPVDIQFGGGCRQICGYGNLHFLRISMLPSGVTPGAVKILNMDTFGPVAATLETPTIPGTDSPVSTIPQLPTTNDASTERLVFDNSQQQQGRSGPLDILTSLISGSTPTEQAVGFNYQIESKQAQPAIIPAVPEVPAVQPQPAGIPFLGANLNINDLFQRLVATGIVSTAANTSTAQQPQGEAPLKPVDFSDPNSLKERQAGIINMLYSGIQCSSCGVRFAPEETVKYSRHLDWHFRQNRREKDAARKGQSRKWYYDVSDWIQFEEIEDLEERAQSWFETESAGHVDETAEQEEIKSVPAPPGDENVLCELCRDRFDTFYNEEKEEWHLKPCVLVEEKYYHPFCYEDLINMPEESLVDKTNDSINSVKEETPMDESKPDVEHDVKMEVETEEEAKIEVKDEIIEEKPIENAQEIAKSILDDLIGSVVYQEEFERQKAEEEEREREREREREKEAKEEEILVLENVKVEQQKNIISVDLSEKLDDEDDIVYQRKTPSPIVLDPTVKIKQEPVDEMESPVAVVDQTYTNVVSSIDGNVEMIEAPQVAPAAPSKIKITFNKPITTETSEKKIEKTDSNDAVEVPQEEDPEPLPLKPKKSRIAERELQICLPVVKGTEVSGLCSIM